MTKETGMSDAQLKPDSPVEIVTLDFTRQTPLANYVFLVHNHDTGQTCVVDPVDDSLVKAELDARGWVLSDILLTHHHHDHIDGTDGLRTDAVRVIGAANDSHRLPALDLALRDGQSFELCGAEVDAFDVSGHTVGHLAYYVARWRALFTGDSLLACGCGRLFEGTPAQLWASLCALRQFPQETLVYSGHEYTETNIAFALGIEPENSALVRRRDDLITAQRQGRGSVPSTLALEMATNPFLRADLQPLQRALNMIGEDAVDVVAKMRRRRDVF